MTDFSGSDWALIITAVTGFLGMLGTQIAQLKATRENGRHLKEAKATANETKAVIDNVKTQTDGLVARAVAGALAQGTAEGNLAGRLEQTAENKEAKREGGAAGPTTIPEAIGKVAPDADETLDHIPNKPVT